MDKEVIVKFDPDAHKEYEELQEAVAQGKKSSENPSYEQLLSSINDALRNIKANPNFGNLVPRKNITKGVVRRYGTDKIFRVELVGFWRLLYTLIGDEARIIAFVLEYVDHKRYNKIFGYRKR